MAKNKQKSEITNEKFYLKEISSKYSKAIKDQFEKLGGLKKRLENSKKIFESNQEFERYKVFKHLMIKNFEGQINPKKTRFTYKAEILDTFLVKFVENEKEEIILDILTNYLGTNFKFMSSTTREGVDILELACGINSLKIIKLCVELKRTSTDKMSLESRYSETSNANLLFCLLHPFLVSEKRNPTKNVEKSLLISQRFKIIDYFCEIGINLDAKNADNMTIIESIPIYLFKQEISVTLSPIFFKYLITKGASLKVTRYDNAEGKEFLKTAFKFQGIEAKLEECFDIVSQRLFKEIKKARPDVNKVREILTKNYLDLEALDNKFCNFLHYAAWHGYEKDILTLLKSDNNINQRDRFGMTPILYAANNDNIETVLDLIMLGADINISNILNQTLMHYAAKKGWIEILELSKHDKKLLLARTKKGYLPTHAAVSSGSLKAVEYLLSLGEDINAVTYNGDTMLLIAAKKDFRDIFNYLTSMGALVNIPNKSEVFSGELLASGEMEEVFEISQPSPVNVANKQTCTTLRKFSK